jgi:hypothetical protein
MKLYHSKLWSESVKTLALPALIFKADGNPALTPAEFSVFAACCSEAQTAARNCRFTLTLSELQELTGYKRKESVSVALTGLQEKQFIKAYGEKKHRAPRTYELCDPRTGEGLASTHTKRSKWLSLRVIDHLNSRFFNSAG